MKTSLGSRLARPLDYWLLWWVVSGSRALTLVLVRTLLAFRDQGAAAATTAVGGLEQAESALADFRAQTFNYTFRVDQTFPVRAEVPISTTVQVPVRVIIPVDTIITVPFDTPLGQFPINVPIQATLPVSLTLIAPLNLTVPISMDVPVQFDAPVKIVLADTPLAGALDKMSAFLRQMKQAIAKGR